MSRIAPVVPLLGLTLLGCSAPATPATMLAQPQPSTSAPATTTTSTSSAASDLHACYEGQCEITVSGPVSFPVDPRLGYDTISVSLVDPDTVSVEATAPGRTAKSTIGLGATSSFGNIEMRVVRISHGTAVLQFLR